MPTSAPPSPTIAAIVVAAGRGLRAGGPVPKQWHALAGAPVLATTLGVLAAIPQIGPLVVVIHPDDRPRMDRLGQTIRRDLRIVDGGATRAASVRAGLESLVPDAPDLVLIHDAARPLVTPDLIGRVIAALETSAGAAPALAVADALWHGPAGHVTGFADRAGLWRAQTPQGFRFDAILGAHRALRGDAADDVAVAHAAGIDIRIVAGDPDNFKITDPDDFARAEQMLRHRQGHRPMLDIRTGNGFDVHAFGPGDHVVLCGVKIPFNHGLVGHSDADVGMHAVTDALYGALAAGDIGTHFPPSDPQWKGASSEIFLAHACALARSGGFSITHIDVTLICEAPKIGPHAMAMRAEMARIMDLDTGRVSVKATTSEKLGFTGRGEGIAALATATLVQR